jgi:Ca2+:H+ antiporter
MKQRRAKRKQTESRGLRATLAAEAPGLAGLATLAIVYLFHERLFADLHNYPLTILLFLWLFGTLLWCAFSVVRHADVVAEHLGEPHGTLVLTLSVIIIEVSVLASVMLHGDNPTLRATPCSRRS